MSLRDFLHMGGYAGFVWSAFSLTAAVLVGMALRTRARFHAERTAAGRRLNAESAR